MEPAEFGNRASGLQAGAGGITPAPVSRDGDFMDLPAILLMLFERRLWLLAGITVSVLSGIVYSFAVKPVYHSRAIIALKESDKGGGSTAMLSQLGGFGGMVASQLGIGNTNLSKIEVILNGHDLAEKVISENNLLPGLFPDNWDANSGKWLDSSEAPSLRDGVKALRSGILAVSVDEKRKMMIVGANSHDPAFAKRVVEYYLAELNKKLLADVKSDATANREFLVGQMNKTHDPMLQEKISAMIATEIEKFMLVSSRSFEVLETPQIPLERDKPKRKLIVAISMVMGLMASVTAILAWPFVGRMRAMAGEIRTRK